MQRSQITSIVLLTVAVGGCAAPQLPASGTSVKMQQLRKLASDAFGLDVSTVEREGAQDNMVGFRSKDVLVSKRNDSRTFFVEDVRYKSTKEESVTQESDEALVEASYEIMLKLWIPRDEISRASVLSEKVQTARYDSSTKTYIRGEIRVGKKYVEMERSMHGIRVFSSRALIGLMPERRVGSLEVHWPEIPQKVLVEAGRYLEAVKQGWKPPEQSGAVVETVEAGIIHSPAIGFAMDLYPVIRVIYGSEDKQIGRKPVRYFDIEGHSVPLPRTFEKIDEPPLLKKRTMEKDSG